MYYQVVLWHVSCSVYNTYIIYNAYLCREFRRNNCPCDVYSQHCYTLIWLFQCNISFIFEGDTKWYNCWISDIKMYHVKILAVLQVLKHWICLIINNSKRKVILNSYIAKDYVCECYLLYWLSRWKYTLASYTFRGWRHHNILVHDFNDPYYYLHRWLIQVFYRN